MTWREDMQPASFRGAPFHVESISRTEQLHADEQVFPGRASAGDAVHVEHLGAGPERFQVDAFVFGDDVRERRDALEAALSRPGSGRLVHPYRGERTVSIIGQVQTSEDRKRGGVVRISFQCVVTESPTLRRTPDTTAIVERDLDAFLDELATDFDEQFDDEVPTAFKESSSAALEDWNASLTSVYSSVLSGVGEVSDFATDVSAVVGEAADGSGAPGLARLVIDGTGRIASAPERLLGSSSALAAPILAALRPLRRFGEDFAAILGSTANRLAERRNRDAVVQLVRGAAIGQTIVALARLPFDSRADAIAARDELVDDLDRLVDEGSAGGDTDSGARLYERLAAARAATVEHLSAIARALPELDTYTSSVALPALVIAHELYGDALREDEIVARNDPSDPSWILADTELEVLRG